MIDGMGGTAIVLPREVSCEASIMIASNRREPERCSEPAGSCGAAIEATDQSWANDLEVAVGLNQRAMLYRERGEDSKAEPLLQRALAIQEHTLGPAHPHVAITLTHLMYLYRHQGKETAAIAAAARATQILALYARESVLT